MTGRVEGVSETLRALKEVDPKLRRQIGRTIRRPAEQMRNNARARLPESPLSNWKYGRYRYDQGAAAAGIGIKIGTGGGGGGSGSMFGGLVGTTTTYPLVVMMQRNAGGAVYEVAGRRSSGKTPQGRAFIAGLNRHASPSRAMWKAAEDDLPAVEGAVVEAIHEVSRDISARLRAR